MAYHYHDESIITELPEDTVFVFGSNMAGQHTHGAARVAAQHFGAVNHVGRGWAGQSFAIPTLNEHLQRMPLSQIEHYIDDFKIYAQHHPKMKYSSPLWVVALQVIKSLKLLLYLKGFTTM